MKKFLSILFILGMLPMLFACKSEQAAPEQQEAVDYVEFLSKNQANWMSVEEAEKVLKDEKVDKASKEYREAAYTVTKDSVSTMIKDAREQTENFEALPQKQKDQLSEAFAGIYFRFLDGTETFQSETVRQKIRLYGTYAPYLPEGEEPTEGGEQWYLLTFHDRTLAQVSVNMTKGGKDHSLTEYTKILELLLSEPNITVRVIN